MPFEGEPHAATWMTWPLGADEWVGQLPQARQEYAALTRAILACEPVRLLLGDEESAGDVAQRLGDLEGLQLHPLPLNDCWLRDNGPTFVRHSDGRVLPLLWRFNAWGNKYPHELDAAAAALLLGQLGITPRRSTLVNEGGSLEVDGAGTLLTTTPCLLSVERNPDWTRDATEAELRTQLGLERVIWLEHGLVGDHTDGHIDTLTRFVAPGRVVTAVSARSDENHEPLQANLRVLQAAGLEVWELPIPQASRTFNGVRLPETYANFYLCNGAVLVPQYGDVHDDKACEILARAFPDRRVEPLSARAIITSGGAFHCLTQQQPAGQLWGWP